MRTKIQNLFLLYIRTLAKLQLKKIHPIIVGVTGSEGKTSTTDAIKLVLETKYKVKKTGKANSETGIPLDILGLEVKSYSMLNWIKLALLSLWKLLTNWEKYDVYVVEMGIDSISEPKNMSYLLKILTPKIGILTSISSVHAENYQTLLKDDFLKDVEKIEFLKNEIAKEKGKLITAAIENGGHGIVNIDNEYIGNFIIDKELDIHGVSNTNIKNPKLLQILEVANTDKGFLAKYKLDSEESELEIKDSLLGEEYAYTFGFAIQTALLLQINFHTAIKALERYKAPEGRFRLLEGINNSKIIDSSYNSSPVTLEYALCLFKKLESKGRKIAVLGDMRELGDKIEKEEHEKMARTAAKFKFDKYYLVGKNMASNFAHELLLEGIDKKNIRTFKNSLELGEELRKDVQQNDLILVKGSQNTVFLEEAIKQILPGKTLQPSEPSNLLCRQSKWWL
ncbi:UDP-N-acetylmuramoyl-tripeptide--D-alanyl-D-alanine ligase, partial [Candidatus Dojkabacteria bacterium]|nr:UDP-N-acetylmuramoyl-tripeptide--D-alanyl-D-alanine ligase [Candidatus Dojkabacteria bacterium]